MLKLLLFSNYMQPNGPPKVFAKFLYMVLWPNHVIKDHSKQLKWKGLMMSHLPLLVSKLDLICLGATLHFIFVKMKIFGNTPPKLHQTIC